MTGVLDSFAHTPGRKFVFAARQTLERSRFAFADSHPRICGPRASRLTCPVNIHCNPRRTAYIDQVIVKQPSVTTSFGYEHTDIVVLFVILVPLNATKPAAYSRPRHGTFIPAHQLTPPKREGNAEQASPLNGSQTLRVFVGIFRRSESPRVNSAFLICICCFASSTFVDVLLGSLDIRINNRTAAYSDYLFWNFGPAA